jgi:hypothetical protein
LGGRDRTRRDYGTRATEVRNAGRKQSRQQVWMRLKQLGGRATGGRPLLWGLKESRQRISSSCANCQEVRLLPAVIFRKWREGAGECRQYRSPKCGAKAISNDIGLFVVVVIVVVVNLSVG